MMKRVRFYFFLISLCMLQSLLGQKDGLSADELFLKARDIAFEGNRQEARTTLDKLLNEYPEYTDASILIAKTYSWDGDHAEARKRLNRITSDQKSSEDAWIAAVKNEIYAKNFNIALGLANKGLGFVDNSGQLHLLRNQALEGIKKQQQIYEVLKLEKETEKRRNAIAISNSTEIFEAVFDPTYQTSLEYRRNTKYGPLIPKLTYNRRFDISGLQYELDAYPKFSKKLHSYFNYAYSDAVIFPKQKIGAELFIELPKALEASLGGRYLQFEDGGVGVLTGTFGFYRGNYYMSLRPYLSMRSSREISPSGSLLARKYLKDGSNYLGMNISYGFDTELNQFVAEGVILSETLLFIESGRVLLEYQFAAKDRGDIYKASLGVNRQEFAFDPGSYVWSISAGFRYQVRF